MVLNGETGKPGLAGRQFPSSERRKMEENVCIWRNWATERPVAMADKQAVVGHRIRSSSSLCHVMDPMLVCSVKAAIANFFSHSVRPLQIIVG